MKEQQALAEEQAAALRLEIAEELNDQYRQELFARNQETEKVARFHINQAKAEYEGKLKRLQEHNVVLLKQTEALEARMHEREAEHQLQRIVTPDRVRQSVLCSKCNAFVQVEQQLAAKVSSLKRFLASNAS